MNSNEIRTITPDEFAAEYAPAPFQKPDDYFIRNRETGKLELHFAKATYDALDDAQKRDQKLVFVEPSFRLLDQPRQGTQLVARGARCKDTGTD